MIGYIVSNQMKLCGIDVMNKFESGGKLILDFLQDIPRIIPYSATKKDAPLFIDKNNGLMEFRDSIAILKNYEEILNDNYCVLDKIKKLKNKYEHKMHNIKLNTSASSSSKFFDYTFTINKKTITISAYFQYCKMMLLTLILKILIKFMIVTY